MYPTTYQFFSELKHDMTLFPVLTCFGPDKLTFIHTDWSSEGMGWILMQPTTDKEYQHSSTVLKYTGTRLFRLSPYGAWLQPIIFSSQSCTYFGRKYHSFFGETSCVQWSIGKNCPYLWGVHFWWI